MQNIRDPHRGHYSRRLQARESRGIIDHVIGEQNLLPAARLKVSRRGVVHAAHHHDSGEEINIFPVPETVYLGYWELGRRRLSCRGVIVA